MANITTNANLTLPALTITSSATILKRKWGWHQSTWPQASASITRAAFIARYDAPPRTQASFAAKYDVPPRTRSAFGAAYDIPPRIQASLAAEYDTKPPTFAGCSLVFNIQPRTKAGFDALFDYLPQVAAQLDGRLSITDRTSYGFNALFRVGDSRAEFVLIYGAAVAFEFKATYGTSQVKRAEFSTRIGTPERATGAWTAPVSCTSPAKARLDSWHDLRAGIESKAQWDAIVTASDRSVVAVGFAYIHDLGAVGTVAIAPSISLRWDGSGEDALIEYAEASWSASPPLLSAIVHLLEMPPAAGTHGTLTVGTQSYRMRLMDADVSLQDVEDAGKWTCSLLSTSDMQDVVGSDDLPYTGLASAVAAAALPDATVVWDAPDGQLNPHQIATLHGAKRIDAVVRIASACGTVAVVEPGASVLRVRRYADTPMLRATAIELSFDMAEPAGSAGIIVRDMQPSVSIHTDEARAVIVVAPWRDVTVEVDGVESADKAPMTETLTERIEIVRGVGSVSRPVLEVISSAWIVGGPAALLYAEDTTNVWADSPISGVVDVTYQTRAWVVPYSAYATHHIVVKEDF